MRDASFTIRGLLNLKKQKYSYSSPTVTTSFEKIPLQWVIKLFTFQKYSPSSIKEEICLSRSEDLITQL